MTRIFLLQLALSSALFFGGGFQANAQGKEGKDPTPTPSPEQQEEERTEDPIYSAREVDVRAKVRLDESPSPGPECLGRRKHLVMVRAVLSKSGKVTEVELVKGSGCSTYDREAIRVVQNLKFKPAMKNNRPVFNFRNLNFYIGVVDQARQARYMKTLNLTAL